MATEISLIASLLHLPAIGSVREAKKAVEEGHFLMREDDVKDVVVKLRNAHDAERVRRDGLLAALKDAREELRLLREKDDCGPYDPTLKGRIEAAIAAAEAAP